MLKNHFQLHFLVILWSFTGILGKLISFQALELAFWRVLFTFIILLLGLKILKRDIMPSGKSIWKLLVAGMIIGLHWVLFFGAIKASNVSVALSTLSTGALFSAFLEPLFFKRKIALYEVFLSLIVVVCLLMIFHTNPQYWVGILMGIACSFLSALFSIANSFLQRNHSAHQITLYEMLGSFLVISVILFFTGDTSQLFNFQNNDLLWLIILAGVLTAYPMVKSVELLKYFSPYTLLLTINLEPVYGVILAYFIFGESERMSFVFYLATIIMFLVIILNGIIKNRKKKNAIES